MRFGIVNAAAEFVFKPIRADYVFVVADRYRIDADAFGDGKQPIVGRNACEDMFFVYFPMGADAAVFDPYIGIFNRKGIIYSAILYKNCRMRFYLFVKNKLLIIGLVLER